MLSSWGTSAAHLAVVGGGAALGFTQQASLRVDDATRTLLSIRSGASHAQDGADRWLYVHKMGIWGWRDYSRVDACLSWNLTWDQPPASYIVPGIEPKVNLAQNKRRCDGGA